MRVSDDFVGGFDSIARIDILIFGHQLSVLDGEDAGSELHQ